MAATGLLVVALDRGAHGLALAVRDRGAGADVRHLGDSRTARRSSRSTVPRRTASSGELRLTTVSSRTPAPSRHSPSAGVLEAFFSPNSTVAPVERVSSPPRTARATGAAQRRDWIYVSGGRDGVRARGARRRGPRHDAWSEHPRRRRTPRACSRWATSSSRPTARSSCRTRTSRSALPGAQARRQLHA